MGISDYTHIVADEITGEDDQIEINEESLYRAAKREFLKDIRSRVSKHVFKDKLDEISEADDQFWISVFKETIRVYSLNGLKLFSHIDTMDDIMIQDVKDLLLFIKVDLAEKVLFKEFDFNMKRYELEEYLKELEAPKLMINAVKLTDDSSLGEFFKKLKTETQQPLFYNE
ncbi:MAG: hypothetical protein KAS32_12210 [Candidatus Peribacteraceae bacterium]|nr:hypothetical protein [Candidatus Peribacteraceae bacterium]